MYHYEKQKSTTTAGSSNGRTFDFESNNVGSIPTPASRMIPSALTGKRLEEWRVGKGWSRSYVAKRAGKTYGWIWGLEIGDKLVPLDAALIFAAIDINLDPLS